jgi:hypothetical protein
MAVTAPPGITAGTVQFILESEREGFTAILFAISEKMSQHDANVRSFLTQIVQLNDSVAKLKEKAGSTKFRPMKANIQGRIRDIEILIDDYNAGPTQQTIAKAFRDLDHLINNTTSVPATFLQRWFPRVARRGGQAVDTGKSTYDKLQAARAGINLFGIPQVILDSERTVRTMANDVLRHLQNLARHSNHIETEIAKCGQDIDGLKQLT